MMNVFMKPRNKYYETYSNYSGLVVIYAISAIVAATVIYPSEEHWYFVAIKAILWPLYLLTKIL